MTITRTMGRAGLRLLPLAVFVSLTIGGCAVVPEPMSDAERNVRGKEDVASLFMDMEPVVGEVSLHEAFARALKYNFDYRLCSMEQSMAANQLDLASYDMLPRLTLLAGYSSRSNDAGSRSVDLDTGVESTLYSGAEERTRRTGNAAFAWNILDFGVSYVRAQQQAVQVLIAEESKRKVVQNISQDVRQAFWRAYVAQNTLPRLDDLLNRVKEALIRSERIESAHMMPPLQALAYQRALLDLHQQIVSRRQELIVAKSELNALINQRPGAEITLTAGNEEDAAALQSLDDINALDQAALNNRPELREEDYRKKLTVLEGRKALLGMLPGIEIDIGNNYDSNKFNLHNDWANAGATVSFNLMRAFSYPAQKRVQETQANLDDTRRVALTMAVLTQVRISVQRYQEAVADYKINVQGAEVDRRIAQHTLTATQANAESEMELLRAEVKAALSNMQRYVALANLQIAYARVANSVGADLLPNVPQKEGVKAFTAQLAQADTDWRKTNFHTTSGAPPSITLYVAPVAAPPGSGLDLAALMRTRLTALGATVSASEGEGAKIDASVTVGAQNAGMRSVELIWTVRCDGKILATIPYRSVISNSIAAAWPVFGEAVTEAAAVKIVNLLRGDMASLMKGKN